MNMVPTHPVAAIWKGFLPLQDILARWPCRSVPPIPSQWLPPSARSRMQTITEITMIITITITTIVTITSEARGHEARLHTHTHLLLHKFPHALPLSWNALQGGQNETWCLQQIRYVPDIIIQLMKYIFCSVSLSWGTLQGPLPCVAPVFWAPAVPAATAALPMAAPWLCCSGACGRCGSSWPQRRHSSERRCGWGFAKVTLQWSIALALFMQNVGNCLEYFGILRMRFWHQIGSSPFKWTGVYPCLGIALLLMIVVVGQWGVAESPRLRRDGAWGSTVWQWPASLRVASRVGIPRPVGALETRRSTRILTHQVWFIWF